MILIKMQINMANISAINDVQREMPETHLTVKTRFDADLESLQAPDARLKLDQVFEARGKADQRSRAGESF